VTSFIRSTEEVAVCLNGYDQTAYPEGSQWSFTRFYLPQALDAGYRLVSDAAVLWNAFEAAHHRATLPGRERVETAFFAVEAEFAVALNRVC
jgi:hypothetical protein